MDGYMLTEAKNTVFSYKFLFGVLTGIVMSFIYNLDKKRTKELLLQKTTLLGLLQVIMGLVMVYTDHPEIGGGLITAGFALVVYQPRGDDNVSRRD